MAERKPRDDPRNDSPPEAWRRQPPDPEPDVAEEHDSLTVADDPLDEPAESDSR